MPLVGWLVIRMARAVMATARLLTSPRVLRSLPWPYIRALARRDRWIGLLVLTIPVTAVAAVTTAAAPERNVRVVAWTVALVAGGLGVVSSWIRALADRQRRS